MKTKIWMDYSLVLAMTLSWGLLCYTAFADAHPRDNCECSELRAIRRILEQQFRVVCDERRCLPVPTPTASTGGPLE